MYAKIRKYSYTIGKMDNKLLTSFFGEKSRFGIKAGL